jgi:hypothetical protein
VVTIVLDNVIAHRQYLVAALMVRGLNALGFEASYIRHGLPRDSRHKLTETGGGVDSQSSCPLDRSDPSECPRDSNFPWRTSRMKTRFTVVAGFGTSAQRLPIAAAETVGRGPPRPGATDISVSVLHAGTTLWISGRNPAKGFVTRFSVTCPDTPPRFNQGEGAMDGWHSAALELAAGLVGACLGRPFPSSSPLTESRAGLRAHCSLVSP